MIKRIYYKLIDLFPQQRKKLERIKDCYRHLLFQVFKSATRITLENRLINVLKKETRGNVLEIAPQILAYKKYVNYSNYATLDIKDGPGVNYVADIHDLKMISDSFDTIVMTEVLEHLYNPFLAVDQLYRICKPGGVVIASTRFVFPYHEEPYDYFRYTIYGIGEIFKEFREVQIITHGNLSLAIWDLITHYKLLRVLRILNRPICFLSDSKKANNKENPLGFIVIAKKL